MNCDVCDVLVDTSVPHITIVQQHEVIHCDNIIVLDSIELAQYHEPCWRKVNPPAPHLMN